MENSTFDVVGPQADEPRAPALPPSRETDAVSFSSIVPAARTTFLGSLSFDVLQKARAVVFRTHMKHYPVELMTVREADRIIESMGPKAMEIGVRNLINHKLA